MISGLFSEYRKAFSGLPKQVWLLSLIMLVNRSGTMVVPFMTIYLTSSEMNYSIAMAGIVMGCFGAGAIAGGYLGGRISDAIGHKPVQIFTLGAGGILFIILGQIREFEWICAFTFLLSIVNEAFRPANSSAIALYSSDGNRTRSFSLNRLAVNLGWAVGGLIGGLLASINYEVLFWVDGFTNMIAAILLFKLLGSGQKLRLRRSVRMRTEKVQSPYRDHKYLVFIGMTILFSACFFQMFSTLFAYLKNVSGFSSIFIGILMAVNGLVIAFIEMILVFHLEGGRAPTFYIVVGVLTMAAAYLLLAVIPATHIIALVIILLITMGEIFAMPFMNSYWTSRSNEMNRGQYAGLYTIAWSIAHTTGPLAGGMVANAYGYTTLWWSVAGVCICSAFGYYYLHKKS